jgi:hypothetical protein
VSARLVGLVVATSVALGVAPGPGGAAGEAEEARPETRATMRELFQALTTAFTASLSEARFQHPEAREGVQAALAALARNAEKLQSHGRELDPSFDFLRRSLADDAREIARRYQDGSYESARFLLQQLTEDCFACHSRLPSDRGFDLGRSFLATADLRGLTRDVRVKLEVATRQFDAALGTFEAIFRDPGMDAAEISLSGAFEDYLKIVLRVRGDVPRATRTLSRFRERPDVPRYLRKYLDGWVASLGSLDLAVPAGAELARARDLIREGQLANFYPEDRQGLVQFVAASSLLHRHLGASPRPDKDLAEVYYLLGVTESYISRSAWVSETEFFLETAIREDPKSPYAERAYAFLEEYVLAGYTGSSGLHLPAETAARLEELRGLLGGS